MNRKIMKKHSISDRKILINRVVERKTKVVQSAQKSPKKEPKKHKKSFKMPKTMSKTGLLYILMNREGFKMVGVKEAV